MESRKMLKILTSQQIKELDQYTIAHEPVSSIDLMERACRAFTDWFVLHFRPVKKIGIVCGTGNNGGDGLGIARMLKELGYSVKVWIVRGDVKESNDFKINFQRLGSKIPVFEIVTEQDQNLFKGCDTLIDAIFGSGLSRPTEGIYAQAINCISATDAIRLAVDIPSGLMADSHSSGSIVKADHTITFQLPKLAFLLPENSTFVGNWHLVDIGLSKTFLIEVQADKFFLDQKSVRKILKPRLKFSHKGTFGHALLLVGSIGKMGAAVLAARAALRSGVGLLTVRVPAGGNVIMQTSVPETMTSIDANDHYLTELPSNLSYEAVGVGPGIGQHADTVKMLGKLFESYRKPIVLDADALNILADSRELLHLIPANSILTPHPKEFSRLAGEWKNDFERLDLVKKLAASLKSVIVLKGAHTTIALPDGNVYFNSTGNPGMATGGSGDVLTGILTGLLAQGYSFSDAAILGVYLHGLSGDIAARELGMNSLISSDLVNYFPQAFKALQGK
jgi:NAD(P)H-hydrate epimerase